MLHRIINKTSIMKKINYTNLVLDTISSLLAVFAFVGIIGLLYHLFTGGLAQADFGIY